MTEGATHEMQYQLHADPRWLLGPGGPDEATAVASARHYWRSPEVTAVRVLRCETTIIHQNRKTTPAASSKTA